MPGTWEEHLKENEEHLAQFNELRRTMREDSAPRHQAFERRRRQAVDRAEAAELRRTMREESEARYQASELRRLEAIERAEKAKGRFILLRFS